MVALRIAGLVGLLLVAAAGTAVAGHVEAGVFHWTFGSESVRVPVPGVAHLVPDPVGPEVRPLLPCRWVFVPIPFGYFAFVSVCLD